jgi:integrase
LVDLTALEKHFLGMDCVPDDYVVRFRGGLVPRRSGPNPRDRILSPKELAAVWIAAGDAGRFGVIIKLCLYSAQRVDKILSMRWSDLNLENGEWRIPTLKGKKGVPRLLVLPPAAITLIRTQLIPETQLPLTPFVFHSTRARGSGYMTFLSGFKRDLGARLPPMERWVMHDLRRSARSMMDQIKLENGMRAIDPLVAEAVLGHKLGGVLGIYARYDYAVEMKVALERLAAHLHKIVGENTATSVPAATTAAA